MVKTKQIINKLMEGLNPRQKEFLEERFGLVDGAKKTLQKLGEKYGITRERVRQVESEGLKITAKNFKKSGIAELVKVSQNHLILLGGIRKESDFVNDLKYLLKDDTLNKNQLRFLFEIVSQPLYHCEDDNWHAFWHTDKNAFKKANSFVSKTVKLLSAKKTQLAFSGQAEQHLARLAKASNLQECSALNYLSVSKKFGVSPYNDFGLAEWEEINPKTAKAKSFLVLKKHNKPLHFKQIAEMINETGFDNKPAYAQTIHNELIKDKRFVLVGRGIYGLREQGYVPGTAKDVIHNILKNKGPLYSKELVELVSQQRFLKENTILLNLQNKKHFKKLPGGKYHIA
ncbi:MAG: sigma factor-like helix-turn-helix DNA-binding protein [Patescibacteria group bacterium]|nr:sigma factor-like helix-turn-helix DNA-binding protein [Patescibacteria group bacterium]